MFIPIVDRKLYNDEAALYIKTLVGMLSANHPLVNSNYPAEDMIHVVDHAGILYRPRIVKCYSPDEPFTRIELGTRILEERCERNELHDTHADSGYINGMVYAHRICRGR